MVSKNNKRIYEEKMNRNKFHYGLRKLNIGVMSVLLGIGLGFGVAATTGNASADTATPATANEASPKPADSVTTPANKAANYDYSYTNPDSPAATAPTTDSNGIQTSADTQSPAFVDTIYYKDKVSGQDVQAPSVIKVWYTRNPKVPSEHLNDPGATENGGIPYGDWQFHKMTITGSPIETAGTDVQPMTPENTPEMMPKFNSVLPKYGSGENISTAERFDFSTPWVGPNLAGYQRLGSTNYLMWNDFVPDKFHNEAGNAVSQTIYYIKEEKTTKQVSQDLTFTLHYKYFDGDKAGQTAAPDKTVTAYFTHEETTIKTPKIENGNIVKDADGNVEYDTKVTNGQVKLDTTKGDGKGYVTSDGSQWNIADVATRNADGSLKGCLTLDNWSAVPVIDGYVLGSAIVNNEDKVDYPTTVRGSIVNVWGNPLQLNYFSSDNPSYPFNTDHTAYYFQVGKIVPVDENGTPIKGADTPSYPNDPNNPQGVKPNEPVPSIPGYKPEVPTVTPTNPGENTPVKYTPIINDKTVDSSQTVNYQGAGDKTPATNQQTFKFEGKENEATGKTTWNEDSHKYNDVKTPVVDGYYADKDEVPGTTATPADPTSTTTVTYKELGKIIPKDENGNPIPNAPTPTYNNDPNDPTKGGETPVPSIPGYNPEVPTVTPTNPGENTPVKYVPVINDNDDVPSQDTTPKAPKTHEVTDYETHYGYRDNWETRSRRIKSPQVSDNQSVTSGMTNQLPQTGNDSNTVNNLSALGLLGASIISLMGVGMFNKKRKK